MVVLSYKNQIYKQKFKSIHGDFLTETQIVVLIPYNSLLYCNFTSHIKKAKNSILLMSSVDLIANLIIMCQLELDFSRK